jgi:hypothetical protein
MNIVQVVVVVDNQILRIHFFFESAAALAFLGTAAAFIC